MGNPFVQIKATGEVGRVDLETFKVESGLIEVEFFDSPSKSFKKRLRPDELQRFIPEENGLMWIPIRQEIDGRKSRIYHRATYRFTHDDGRWGVLVRYLNSSRKSVEALVSPEDVTILRSGLTVDVAGCLGDMMTISTKYAATRQRLLNDLYGQLKVARGYRAILSSGVRPFAHQINTMVRVLSDPIPRFILADEVGLGKTIEAGLIIRQTLIDNPNAHATVLCPDFLVGQWINELNVKLHLGKWLSTGQVKVHGFSAVNGIEIRDVLVVDEAHQITNGNLQLIYDEIELNIQPSTTLLLLTATPMRGNRIDFLKLLHLVDPGNYSLEDLEKFEERLALREKTARLIESLRNPNLPKEILVDYLSRLMQFFGDDSYFQTKTREIFESLKEENEYVNNQIELSIYLRESYRIARRVIRNRRDVVSENGYSVAGRELKDGKPELLEETMRASIDSFVALFLRRLRELESDETLEFAEIVEIAEPVVEGALSSPEVFVAELLNSDVLTDVGMFGTELVELANSLVTEVANLGPSSRWKSVISLCQGHIQNANSNGVVVFVRNEQVAQNLHQELSTKFGAHQVGLHVSSMTRELQDRAVEQFVSTDSYRVLVMDQSGEEGRNLQTADEIVHFSLPLSPNRLEQRLGRSDRFKEMDSTRAVSRVYLEEYSSLSSGQFDYLTKGLNIFERSVGTAQQFLSHEYQNLFRRLLDDGLDAFSGDCEEIAENLQEEIDSIFSIDEIESSAVPEEFSVRDFDALVELDQDSEIEKHALGLLVNDKYRNPPTSALGLSLAPSRWRKQNLTQTMRLSLQTDDERPIDLHGLTHQDKLALQKFVLADNEYAFSRPVVRRLPGAQMFRVGDPFVDWIIKYIEGDELGRTWAVWRQSKSKIAMLSGTIKLSSSIDDEHQLSDWGVASARRRLELALPPQLLHVAVAQGKVIDHDDERTKQIFPWASLIDLNFGDEQWKKVVANFEDFKGFCRTAESSMLRHARQRIQNSEEFVQRRQRANENHASIMSILEVDAANIESPTRMQSLERMRDEEVIHQLITDNFENLPLKVLSMGLIYMSPDKP